MSQMTSYSSHTAMRLSITWNTNSLTPLPSHHTPPSQASPCPSYTQQFQRATTQTTPYLPWQLTHLEPGCCPFPTRHGTSIHQLQLTRPDPTTITKYNTTSIPSSYLSNLHPSQFQPSSVTFRSINTQAPLSPPPPPPPTPSSRGQGPLKAPTKRLHIQCKPSQTSVSRLHTLHLLQLNPSFFHLHHEQKTYA
jgi:hypothetical protein